MALFYLVNYNPQDTFPFIPDISLAYLGGALKKAGHRCKVFDYNPLIWDKGTFFNSIAKDKPNVVGFKVVNSLGLIPSIEFAGSVKELSPSSLIIAGGPHITLCEESILKMTDAFDLLVAGEGEMALVELGEYIEGERNLAEVRNLVFKNNGSIVKIEKKSIDDINELPLPDWSLFSLENYFPIMRISTQRGCPYNCNFCCSSHLWTGLRKRSLNSVQDELKIMIERYGVKCFSITDPTPDPKILIGICEYIDKNSLPFNWYSYGHMSAFNGIDFGMLARGGCKTLIYGIESGDKNILSIMGKVFHPESAGHCFSLARKAGINIIASFIYGFPGENKESLLNTLRLISVSNPDEFVLEPFILQPFSPIALKPDKFEVELDTDFIEKYAFENGGYWKLNGVPGDIWINFWQNKLIKYMDKMGMSNSYLSIHYTSLIAPMLGMKNDEFFKLWQSIWRWDNPDLKAIKEIIKSSWKATLS